MFWMDLLGSSLQLYKIKCFGTFNVSVIMYL